MVYQSYYIQKEVCEGCLMSKQIRKPFPSQASFTANYVMELVHDNFCGPIMPPTLASNKYFFMLVDDFSWVIWVYMLKPKDEAFEAFKRFRMVV